MSVDLHTHTNASDGTLSPESLVALARDSGVTLLSVTDHDTVAGCLRAREASLAAGIDFIDGVELSVLWAGKLLHVVGLGIDPKDEGVCERFREMARLRALRGKRMGEAFERLGFAGAYEGALRLAGGGPETLSRTHFATWLLEKGVVARYGEAFDRYLGEGKTAYVEALWPDLATGVAFLRKHGAIPVLAHPGRYKWKEPWQVDVMLDAFLEAGGIGIEVTSGSQSLAANEFFANVARERKLPASTGSDWHSDRSPRPRPGCQPALPPDLTPVWTLLEEKIRRA